MCCFPHYNSPQKGPSFEPLLRLQEFDQKIHCHDFMDIPTIIRKFLVIIPAFDIEYLIQRALNWEEGHLVTTLTLSIGDQMFSPVNHEFAGGPGTFSRVVGNSRLRRRRHDSQEMVKRDRICGGESIVLGCSCQLGC